MGRKSLIAVLLSAVILATSISPAEAQSTTLDMGFCKLPGNNITSEHRYEDSGHVLDWSRFAKPEGELSALVLPTDFSDVPASGKPSLELGFLSDVSKFFSDSSQGKFSLTFDVPMEWIRLPKSAQYYKQAAWAEKINDAIDLVDPSTDFSEYDLVIFYISKANKITTEAGALPGFPDRTPDGLANIKGVYLGNDYWRQQGQDGPVLIHELMHVFGLPDLYLTNKDGSKNVGVFDIMSEYLKAYGPRLFYWHRWKLGWIDDSQVKCLNPAVAHRISISNRNAAHNFWVIPISDREVHVIQPWIVGKKVQAIAYEVDAKDFVWNTAGLSGSGESPIQMLRPTRAGKAPKSFSNPNLSVVLRNKDRIITQIGEYRVSIVRNQVLVTFSPKR